MQGVWWTEAVISEQDYRVLLAAFSSVVGVHPPSGKLSEEDAQRAEELFHLFNEMWGDV